MISIYLANSKAPQKSNTNAAVSNSIVRKVYILNFDPLIPTGNGYKNLHDVLNWNNPLILIGNYDATISIVSNYIVDYQIIGTEDVNDFPVKEDGFDYTYQSYLACVNNTGPCHKADLVNYSEIINKYNICGKANKGEIDEVWLFGGPYFGFWETAMTGAGAYKANGEVYESSCNRPIPIMGFNYQVDVDRMLHSMSHRVEHTMHQVFFGNNSDWLNGYTPNGNQADTAVNDFLRTGFQISTKGSGCGATHGGLNRRSNPALGEWYDYENRNNLDSYCDDFLNYPNLNYQTTSINCDRWGCNERGFLEYWFKHLPHTSGSTNGISNNWWNYITDQIAVKGSRRRTSSNSCGLWVANCTDNRNYYERDCATQQLFNNTWGDGYARWQEEACQGDSGGGGGTKGCGETCTSTSECSSNMQCIDVVPGSPGNECWNEDFCMVTPKTNRRISGKVLGCSGSPKAGVKVSAYGSLTKSTTTDAQGKFYLKETNNECNMDSDQGSTFWVSAGKDADSSQVDYYGRVDSPVFSKPDINCTNINCNFTANQSQPLPARESYNLLIPNCNRDPNNYFCQNPRVYNTQVCVEDNDWLSGFDFVQKNCPTATPTPTPKPPPDITRLAGASSTLRSQTVDYLVEARDPDNGSSINGSGISSVQLYRRLSSASSSNPGWVQIGSADTSSPYQFRIPANTLICGESYEIAANVFDDEYDPGAANNTNRSTGNTFAPTNNSGWNFDANGRKVLTVSCSPTSTPTPSCNGVPIASVVCGCTASGMNCVISWNHVTGVSQYAVAFDDDNNFWTDYSAGNEVGSNPWGENTTGGTGTVRSYTRTLNNKKMYFKVRIRNAGTNLCTPCDSCYGSSKNSGPLSCSTN